MGKGGENNYFEGPGQDKYKLGSQAPDRDWQSEEGSVVKRRAFSSLCVGVMRHWGMQGGKTRGMGQPTVESRARLSFSGPEHREMLLIPPHSSV